MFGNLWSKLFTTLFPVNSFFSGCQEEGKVYKQKDFSFPKYSLLSSWQVWVNPAPLLSTATTISFLPQQGPTLLHIWQLHQILP